MKTKNLKFAYSKSKLCHISLILLLLLSYLFPNYYLQASYTTFAQEILPTPTDIPAPLSSSEGLSPTSNPEDSEFEELKNSLFIYSSINSLTETGQQRTELKKKIQRNVQNLKKRTFRSTEKIPVVIDNEDPKKVKIEVFDIDGNKVEVLVEGQSISNAAVMRITPPSHFRPGKYHMTITDSGGNVTTQDFTWGVLAINTNKSVYLSAEASAKEDLPPETAKLAIAVLDETGNMVCDAKVALDIKDPQGNVSSHTTEKSTIKVNPQCNLKVFSLEPDFEARYTIGAAGTYEMTLTAVTKNGTYTITDAFEVAENVPFDVERTSATRTFPPLRYPVLFDITANEDFEGEISEVVPESFDVATIEELLPFDGIATHSAEPTPPTSTIALAYPFENNFTQTQGFGVDETDTAMSAKYKKYGLIGHDGLDFALPSGTPILSVDNGVIAKANENGDYGTTIIVQHSWGRSYYGHLSKMEKTLGESVSKDMQIGLSGNTGLLTTGPHLHFGIKMTENNPSNGYYGKVNPLPYLMSSVTTEVQAVATPAAILRSDDSKGVQILTWKVKLSKGDNLKLGYTFLSPPKSPQFYTLGPLAFTKEGEQDFPEFVEQRKWQLAIDADGSGTMTVDPTTGIVSEQYQQYSFNYITGESVATGSGAITIQEPTSDDWTTPQTSNAAAAGYLRTDSSSTGVVGDILDLADSNTSWNFVGSNACTNAAPTVTAAAHPEGPGALSCVNGNINSARGFYKSISSSDWTNYTTVGVWMKANGAQTTADVRFSYDDTAALASPIGNISMSSALVANIWSWETFTLTGTRNAIVSYGITCGSATACDSITWVADYFLIGPGTPTVSGTTPWSITAPIVTIPASTGNIILKYGNGQSTGITNSSTNGTHTFTTRSKIATNPLNSLSTISSSPTVTLVATTAPPNTRLMRGGKWFYLNTGEQPFAF